MLFIIYKYICASYSYTKSGLLFPSDFFHFFIFYVSYLVSLLNPNSILVFLCLIPHISSSYFVCLFVFFCSLFSSVFRFLIFRTPSADLIYWIFYSNPWLFAADLVNIHAVRVTNKKKKNRKTQVKWKNKNGWLKFKEKKNEKERKKVAKKLDVLFFLLEWERIENQREENPILSFLTIQYMYQCFLGLFFLFSQLYFIFIVKILAVHSFLFISLHIFIIITIIIL